MEIKKKVAIIGGGVSGLSIANCLIGDFQVKVFEQSSKPGGLIKCERINGMLYHMVGGHVFNSKRKDVLDWFWKFFDLENDFTKANRNAVVYMDGAVGYPIENHIYQLGESAISSVIADLLQIANDKQTEAHNFEEFLQNRFGKTLYELYFKPYNEKIWKTDLKNVPLSWLEGKLPMPTVEEILYNNFTRRNEMNMVHSSFYYPKNNGSQFLADRLAANLPIVYNAEVDTLSFDSQRGVWKVCDEVFDLVIFTGNIKSLPKLLQGSVDMSSFQSAIEKLEYHGTTSVLCEVDSNPYSWIYLPDRSHASHRIINTGNFSATNNIAETKSATIEFTDFVDKEDILDHLKRIPYSPKYLTHHYTQFTYPVQNTDTRGVISSIKQSVRPYNLFLLGRFAEWEYYNMDAAMGAAIDLSKELKVTV